MEQKKTNLFEFIFKNNVPRWAAGLGVILLFMVIFSNGINLGSLLQNKLDNDKELQLQLQTQQQQNETFVISTITELNRELNERIDILLDSQEQQLKAYNAIIVQNEELTKDVTTLQTDIRIKDSEIERLRSELDQLRIENDELKKEVVKLSAQLNTLTSQRE
jgi:uncharacterized coiled-coil DUF342 family protein